MFAWWLLACVGGLVVIRFSGYCVAGSFVWVAGWACDLVFLLIRVFCVVSRLPGCLCCVVVLFSGCFCLWVGFGAGAGGFGVVWCGGCALFLLVCLCFGVLVVLCGYSMVNSVVII